ncbi:Ankyrin-2 [Folsomia candida]|uniref:Ankyrin-2 n=1 Tax=Folsomia candida TaxID=158441 RepID=A0A226D097_FOLCA|nr:Ankyrin-2 [Folsomia candida]
MPLECISKPLQRELADSIIRLAHPDDLRILLACGAKVNEAVTQGLRPIHYAVWQRYAEAVNLLLVRGCDVNSTDDCGYSPLHLAAEHGYIEMMKMLLANGAKTDYREPLEKGVLYPRTTMSDEPLRLAIKNNHYNAARILLDARADPNARYFFGSEINLVPPLDVEYLDLLLNYGAYPDSRDRQGLTQLMRACRLPQGIESVLCLIQHGADVNAMTDDRHDNRTVLHYAVLSGNLETVSLILKQGARVNFDKEFQKPTPLDLAILKGDVAMAKLLIRANVNASSPIIGSPLHVVSSDNIPNRLALLQVLLEKGADPNLVVISDDGMPLKSPLGEYISSNTELDPKFVRLLLKFGARVIIKSQFRDPLGILNCLANLAQHHDLFNEVLASAEDFDPPIIRRCPALSAEQKTHVLTLSKTPLSLKHQARLYLRDTLGKKLPYVMSELGLPKVLVKYVLFEIR